MQHRSAQCDPRSKTDEELVGIYEGALRSGVVVFRTRPAMRVWVLFACEDGGYGFGRPDRIPKGATLQAELAMRRRTVDEDKFEALRPNWQLEDELGQRRESLVDVLMQAVVGRHIDEGRAPRSNRRLVRAASSRGDPDPEPEPPLALPPRRAG